jgi:uncharacterized phage infection (PIP) family protein YhgE
MADKNYEIKIGSTADTSGIKKADDALKKIDETTEETTKAIDQSDEANQKAIETMDDYVRTGENFGDVQREIAKATREAADATREAAASANEAPRGFAGQLDGTTPRADDTNGIDAKKEAVEDLTEAVDGLRTAEVERTENAESGSMQDDVRRIKTLQYAQVLGMAAQGVGQLAGALRGMAQDFETLDPEMARQINGVAEGLENVSAMASGAAAGAVFGPWGAAVGAGVGLVTSELNRAYEAYLNVKQIEQIGATLPAQFERVKRTLAVREQVDSWEDLVSAMRDAAAEADSQARIDAALRRSNERFAENALRRAQTGGDETQIRAAEDQLNQVRLTNAQADQTAALTAAQRAAEIAASDLANAQKALVLSYNRTDADSQQARAEQAQLSAQIKRYSDTLAAAERALRETQSIGTIERETRVDDGRTQAIADVSVEITRAALDAIAQIQANAAAQGRAPSALEGESINRIQALVDDTTPDAQQGSQLAGILQTLSNNITAKDTLLQNGLEQLLRTVDRVASRYEAIINRITSLEERINQLQ